MFSIDDMERLAIWETMARINQLLFGERRFVLKETEAAMKVINFYYELMEMYINKQIESFVGIFLKKIS